MDNRFFEQSFLDPSYAESLITYFRQGKPQKFFLGQVGKASLELDFMTAAKILESGPKDQKKRLPETFFGLLDRNREAFLFAATEEMMAPQKRGGHDSAARILRILKATTRSTQKFTEDQERCLQKVIVQIEEGGLPKKTAKTTLKALNSLKSEVTNPFKVLAMLQTHIPRGLLKDHYTEQNPATQGSREVILSLYLEKG